MSIRYGAMVNDSEIAAGLAPTPGYRYADRSGSRLYVAGQVPPATLVGVNLLGYTDQLVEIDATIAH